MQNHKPHQAICPALPHFTVRLPYSPITAGRNMQGWVQALCYFSFFLHVFCCVSWTCYCGCFRRNSAHSNVPVIGELLLYCRLFSTRVFSGAQVLSLQSVEESFYFPFPSQGETEVAHHLPGYGDDFWGVAVKGTMSSSWLAAEVTLFFNLGSSETLICSAATSIMLRSFCTCVFMQPCIFTELAF